MRSLWPDPGAVAVPLSQLQEIGDELAPASGACSSGVARALCAPEVSIGSFAEVGGFRETWLLKVREKTPDDQSRKTKW